MRELILLLANHIGDLPHTARSDGRRAKGVDARGPAAPAGSKARSPLALSKEEQRMSGFASTKDLADKTISFDELAPGFMATPPRAIPIPVS